MSLSYDYRNIITIIIGVVIGVTGFALINVP